MTHPAVCSRSGSPTRKEWLKQASMNSFCLGCVLSCARRRAGCFRPERVQHLLADFEERRTGRGS